jgi:hypothetical protein
MPRFKFQVQQGKSEIPAIEDILYDSYAAREAALGLCADLAKDIVNGLTDDSEWRLDVLDESGKAVFRLRLLAESLENTTGLPFAAKRDTPIPTEIKPRHFGVDSPPRCVTCRQVMRLTRRAPHPLYGLEYELQSFGCRKCSQEIHRSADGAGLPHTSDAESRRSNASSE